MASHSVSGAAVPAGVNQANRVVVRAVTTDALANTNTFSVVIPETVDKGGAMVPVGWRMYVLAGGVYTPTADIGLTNHTVSTRTTVFTATNNIAAGAVLLVDYAPAV